jgi:predicted lipoprotein with Yx(FWY)xxD motif
MRNYSTSAARGLAAIAAAGLLAACGAGSAGTSGGQPKTAGGPVISARTVSGIGAVLVDRAGKTLYSPEQEARGTIKCTGGCLSFWLPVTVTKGAIPRAASGVTGSLGTIHRADDELTQLTFDGKPLYTFRLDQAPGQAHGNDFTDAFGGQSFTWHAITASGATAGTSQPGGSSGY